MRTITVCRVCGSTALVPVLNFGTMALTGYFPRPHEVVPTAPIEVVQCTEPTCGLVQLRHTLNPAMLFGKTYGYRSGLNPSMVSHLHALAQWAQHRVEVAPGETVVDIGSSDGTLLSTIAPTQHRVGIDPLAAKYQAWYDPAIEIRPALCTDATLPTQAQLVFSVAMFYDLDAPIAFAQMIQRHLAPTGAWIIEQRYLPTMLQQDAYDTFCHEHLAYHTLRSMLRILSSAGLAIQDVAFNTCNGGSMRLLVQHGTEHCANAVALASQESVTLTDGIFQQRVLDHRNEIQCLLREFRHMGRRLVGYGASTKGNVLLQWCNITPTDLPKILDVNSEKWGRVTPGTQIPIVPETVEELESSDVLLILPWHFREMLQHKLSSYPGELVYPFAEMFHAV